MRYETILDALINARNEFYGAVRWDYRRKRGRQYRRFRAWLIRHDEQQRAEIERLKEIERKATIARYWSNL